MKKSVKVRGMNIKGTLSELFLVTGGAGFIGSHLVDRLVGEGFHVKVLDNFSSGSMANLTGYENSLNVEIFKGDLKDPQATLQAVEGINVVFHYAANPEVRVSTTNPDIHFNENVAATFNLLEAMRKNDVKNLVFASSSSVYGEPETIPVSENAPVKPVSVYGASKAACENLIHAYTRLYGFKATLLRYANVSGPRLRHGVIYDFIIKLLKNPEELEVLGDGTQTRSYIHIADAVEATLTAWKKSSETHGVYNVGSEDWITVNEIAETISAVIGIKNLKHKYKPVAHGVGWLGDIKRIALNTEKLMSLGWKPKMKSREAVSKTAESILAELKQEAKTS